MAANNGGNGSNGPINGDILSALSGDVTLIRGDTSAIRDNTDLLSSMNQNLTEILRNVGNWSQQDVKSRIYDTSNGGRSGQVGPYTRDRGNQDRSSIQDRYQGKPEDFIDSFFKEMEKNLLGEGFQSALQQNMKEFAGAMGLRLEQLPSVFGKALARQIQQSRIGQNITNQLNTSLDNIFNRSIDSMRNRINRYYDRASESSEANQADIENQRAQWDEALNRITQNFRNRRTSVDNDPTPNGADDGANPPNPNPRDDQNNQDSEIPKILEDKLQYLYPIYNSITSINEGVKLITESVVNDADALSAYNDIFKKNSKDNANFIENLLSRNQGSSGGIIDSILDGSRIRDSLGDLSDTIDISSLNFGAGMEGIIGAALPLAGAFIATTAAMWLADKALDALRNTVRPLQESFQELKKTISKDLNRYFESEKNKLQQRTSRLQADVEVLIKKPFEIMESAANDWYNAWDNNLKTINATQGYTKADLQNLMSSYAERLRSENLASTVSAADISNNLAKVLDSGLSGRVAEEFAYVATILNNAIPTQNFFEYASTYASIAANQIALGKSQSAAIATANEQLTQFASSLLYSNRELTGGFSTGLSNASELLTNAVKIANTAGIGDSTYISATLAAVSSIVGALAPDLAGSITDAIVDAALGGNSDSLVALRSLANTGASNTAFLNAFARDPKGVLTTLFTNLSNMQNINATNFMEVAESLSSTFGLSIGALTRIDFASLAESVSNIDVTMSSLDQNMKLLQEGQTTTTAEQLKMNQVNEMILNEGLSYVLDNEAARAIQQHMWDQEIAAQMQEATYGVELQGKALEFLSGIAETVHNILNFLNPFSWLGKIINLGETLEQATYLQADIAKVLEAGKVGSGNAQSFYNLTTYDVDKLTNMPGNLAEMMGEVSQFTQSMARINNRFRSTSLFGITGYNFTRLFDDHSAAPRSSFGSSSFESQYDFATKGLYNALINTRFNSNKDTEKIINAASTLVSTQNQIDNQAISTLQSFLNTMQEYVEADRSYAEWVASSQDFGIVKLSTALEEYGLTLADIQGKYQEYQAAKVTEYDYNRDQKENELWDRLGKFMDEDATQFFEMIETKMDAQINILNSIDSTLSTFLISWQNDWLVKAWSNEWVQGAWYRDWIQSQWGTEWLAKAWRDEWINEAWRNNWLETAWNQDWLQGAWGRDWLQDAWRDSWLNQAWGEQWLNQAWNHDWLEIAWYQKWLENGWNNGFINMWRTEWLEKAWNQKWLTKAWGEDWIKSWNRDWLETSWSQDWLENAWRQEWLNSAWKEDWLNNAWKSQWLQDNWTTKWLETAWKQDWLDGAWRREWIQDAWRRDWIDTAFNKGYVRDVITMLWGNRWWEFFNIFKDRFGGITTEAGDGITSGKVSIDTEGLYQIYTKETGQAAENALREVESADETGDAILALAKQLTQNTIDLRDPQVQTNVLLSQILIVLEAIMQAENTAGGASLATTLAGLGLGLTNPNIADSLGT